MQSHFKVAAATFLLAFLSAPAWTQTPTAPAGRPVPNAWTSHLLPGRHSLVPDASLAGTAGPSNTNQVTAAPVLLIGCEQQGSALSPVIRMTIPSRLGLDLSRLSFNRPTEYVPMTKRVGIRLDGLWGSRAFYGVLRSSTYTLVQYDADEREVGLLASSDTVGKRLVFDVGQLEFRFVLPSANPALLQVLSACHVQPWSPSSAAGNLLSASFAEQATQAVQAIGGMRFDTKQQAPESEVANNLAGYAVTIVEFSAQFEISENFFSVSSAEKGIPPRRTRCVAALTAMFRTRVYKWPSACAYVDREAPP